MSEKITSIARNTSYFTLALVIQKIISLTYFTLYARALGPGDLGQYYFAISVTSIFSIFIDFGLGNIITREVAKRPEDSGKLLHTTLSLKIIFSVLTFLGLWIWTAAWHYEALTRDLIYISAFVILFDNLTGVFYAVLRGYHNLKFESIASVIFQTIVLLFSLVVLGLHGDIRWLMSSLVLASLFNLIYSGFMMRKVAHISIRLSWDKILIKHLLVLALPFALYGVFQRFYTFFDSVLLFKFAGDRAVGLYQIPFKIIVALQFLPMAFTASLYPALSAYWHRNREQLQITFERAINYSLILGIPIMIGTIALAEQIILLFTHEYTEAIVPLQVSIMAVPLMFLAFPIGSLLNACDRQKRNTVNIMIVALVSAALNIYLIPHWGVLGACVTSVVTSLIMIILGWIVVPQIIIVRNKVMIIMLARIVGAGIVMGIIIYGLKQFLPTVATVAIGAIVYLGALYLLRGFSKADIQSIRTSFR